MAGIRVTVRVRQNVVVLLVSLHCVPVGEGSTCHETHTTSISRLCYSYSFNINYNSSVYTSTN